ncbi:MAG: hypothetical protein V4719_08780 [Planctomycetota bacterium]
MTLDELIIEALGYLRNVGCSLGDIRLYVQIREDERHTPAEDRAVLRRLEEDGHAVAVGKKWFLTASGDKLIRGPALKAEWQEADFWILLAEIYNRQSRAIYLSQIIAAADYINHAIPTLEEIHGAINRLQSARLIKTKHDVFYVTDKALELMAQVESSCKANLLAQLVGLARILECPCCGVRLKTVRWRYTLDAAAYKNALKSSYQVPK